MPQTNAEKKKKYFENLKTNGLYDSYLKKRAEEEKERRKNFKNGLMELPKKERERLLKISRESSRRRLMKHRLKKKGVKITNHINLNAVTQPYRTKSALNKAVSKTKKALPASPSKMKAVVTKLFNSFDDEDKQYIVHNGNLPRKSKNGLSLEVKTLALKFYERDDVSRMSPNTKDTRFFKNADGTKELKTIRHLTRKLDKVYAMFIQEWEIENGTDSNHPLKRSKFCALRPPHVKLMSQMPHDVCYCFYHTNFINCCDALSKYLPGFPKYGETVMRFVICENPTKDCWLRNCTKCNCETSKNMIRNLMISGRDGKKSVKWIQWIKFKDPNRTEKTEQNNILAALIEYFISIQDEFLEHSYIKRLQASTFNKDTEIVMNDATNEEAELHIDFAENALCESQGEVVEAHWRTWK